MTPTGYPQENWTEEDWRRYIEQYPPLPDDPEDFGSPAKLTRAALISMTIAVIFSLGVYALIWYGFLWLRQNW
jgi:hypothetical protein